MMLKNTITKMHGEDPKQSTGFIGKASQKLQERNIHVTKRISLSKNPSPDSIAFVGIAGQFYTVVLAGIQISKFSSKN